MIKNGMSGNLLSPIRVLRRSIILLNDFPTPVSGTIAGLVYTATRHQIQAEIHATNALC